MNDMNTQWTARITYQGPPMLANTLAEMLREDAECHVDYKPPQETRDAVGIAALAATTVQFLVQTTGTDDRIKAVVTRFIERFSRAQPQVQIDGQPSDDSAGTSSVADEFAKLASLYAEGHLTDEEFSEAKARVLRFGS
ncbi:SHOCT domain-containing protein [Streptomyces shenzhenensis]|uniref:SHOCT domain-containing protein n=1 Tax=Streptomyces shenzhenensis TaxID=943815 RepID=UPI003821E544